MNVHYKDYLRQWRLWISFLISLDEGTHVNTGVSRVQQEHLIVMHR
jgi:hypothetical protein